MRPRAPWLADVKHARGKRNDSVRNSRVDSVSEHSDNSLTTTLWRLDWGKDRTCILARGKGGHWQRGGRERGAHKLHSVRGLLMGEGNGGAEEAPDDRGSRRRKAS